jgi:hypothetical protein
MERIVFSTPTPDPYPAARPVVTYVAYSYVADAVDSHTGRRLAGEWFRCRVSAGGRRFCVLFRAAD